MGKTTRINKLSGRDFDKLPDAEKERIFQKYVRMPDRQFKKEFRPMNQRERTEHLRGLRLVRQEKA